jgi:hypothetical protein
MELDKEKFLWHLKTKFEQQGGPSKIFSIFWATLYVKRVFVVLLACKFWENFIIFGV